MMTNNRFELPGDVLRDLMRQHEIETVADFIRQHELRVSLALEKRWKEEGIEENISEEEEEDIFDKLALSSNQWYNRFQIVWNAAEKPQKAWRATFAQDDIGLLLFAGWFAEGSEWHERFKNAVTLQNELYLERVSYDDVASRAQVEQKIDVGRAYDAFSFAFFEFVRAHPETNEWSFHTMATFASGLSTNALQALADLGIIDLGDDWMDRLPGLDQTRGSLGPEEQEDWALLERIVDWVTLMLEDRLEGMRG